MDEELKRRGDLFRQLGVQDIAGYKRAGGTEPIPRSLLIIDEFQEFFVEDDRISQTASLLLDRIVRQGRAFGIHVLLGSQTLGGAYTVARTTLGQMVIRIALQCNEADAYLIMDENNPAPRLLSRPGEGIYNDMAGHDRRQQPVPGGLAAGPGAGDLPGEGPGEGGPGGSPKSEVRSPKSGAEGGPLYPGPIVFEGNAPADVRENALLRRLLEAAGRQAGGGRAHLAGRAQLDQGADGGGVPPSEREQPAAGGAARRGDAGHAVGRAGVAGRAVSAGGGARSSCATARRPARRSASSSSGSCRPSRTRSRVAKPGDLAEIMQELAGGDEAAEPRRRMPRRRRRCSCSSTACRNTASCATRRISASPPATPRRRRIPPLVLNNLICEGTRLGFHVIATCDTYNNVNRFLSRKALSEFEMRVLFQMSANDSASLIDNPKASMLGLHRALFYNAQEGYLETFRPYALPGKEWIEQAARNLARLLKQEFCAQPAARRFP